MSLHLKIRRTQCTDSPRYGVFSALAAPGTEYSVHCQPKVRRSHAVHWQPQVRSIQCTVCPRYEIFSALSAQGKKEPCSALAAQVRSIQCTVSPRYEGAMRCTGSPRYGVFSALSAQGTKYSVHCQPKVRMSHAVH